MRELPRFKTRVSKLLPQLFVFHPEQIGFGVGVTEGRKGRFGLLQSLGQEGIYQGKGLFIAPVGLPKPVFADHV